MNYYQILMDFCSLLVQIHYYIKFKMKFGIRSTHFYDTLFINRLVYNYCCYIVSSLNVGLFNIS